VTAWADRPMEATEAHPYTRSVGGRPGQGSAASTTPDTVFEDAVLGALHETADLGRLRVTHTDAAIGWGRVLFVDLYYRPGGAPHEGLDGALRQAVSRAAAHPLERVAIRWRMSA
jgi:hypothetical protein